MIIKILTCSVCRKEFTRPPNLVPKAKVCTPSSFRHKTTYKKEPDGRVRRIPCQCCRCVYKKTLAHQRNLDGKIIPSARAAEFLKTTRKRYGDNVALAFRLGLNAMLRVQEMSSMKPMHVHPDAQPLPRVDVIALKKQVEMVYPVDIDPDMAKVLTRHLKKIGTNETLFSLPVRTLQHKFTQVVKSMGLSLSIHSLRHTGIWNRARSITNLNDLNYLREQARHESIETTKIYLGYEQQERIQMAKKVKWF